MCFDVQVCLCNGVDFDTWAFIERQELEQYFVPKN